MSVFAQILGAFRSSESDRSACFPCAHLCDDPVRVETALPGLAILSSAHASVRAQDGICLRHDVLIDGRHRCSSFRTRAER